MADTTVWVDADGGVHALHDDDIVLQRGARGRAMAPVAYSEEVVPGQAGTRLRQLRTGPSEVGLPLLVKASDTETVRSKTRLWASRFNPLRGDGKLRVTSGATARELNCRYIGGMEGDEAEAVAGFFRFIAIFRAFDPYWYDTSDRVQTFTAGEAATFFPFFPLTLSSSEVYADATVDNAGDVEAWPVWTVTGPGSALVLRNQTTGKVLSLDYTLADGQTVTIDTRPGEKTVTLDDGTNLFGRLSATSSLWPLGPGSNSVRVELTAATAESDVTLTYRRRYFSA